MASESTMKASEFKAKCLAVLDEVRESDILLHVVDVGHPRFEEHITAVNETLEELGARSKPTLMVFNKIDIYREKNFDALLDTGVKKEIERELRANLKGQFDHDNIFVSAAHREGMDELREMVVTMVKREYQVRYPYEVRAW